MRGFCQGSLAAYETRQPRGQVVAAGQLRIRRVAAVGRTVSGSSHAAFDSLEARLYTRTRGPTGSARRPHAPMLGGTQPMALEGYSSTSRSKAASRAWEW